MVMYMGPLAVRHEYGRQFAAAAEKFGKTAAAIINLSETDMRDIFQAKNIPVFDAATDACFRMLRGYIDYGQFLERRKAGAAARSESGSQRAPVRRKYSMRTPAAQDAVAGGNRGVAERHMASSAPKRPRRRLVAEAKAAATRLGFPVILKAMVPDLAHRSDAGLVSR